METRGRSKKRRLHGMPTECVQRESEGETEGGITAV